MHERTLLDISRLFSRRLFDHDTGIDRVERGYLEHFGNDERTRLVLRTGRRVHFFEPNQWSKLTRLCKPKNLTQKIKYYLTLEKLSRSNSTPQNLKDYRGASYINVGHSAHPEWFWRKLRNFDIHKTVMIHDVIPLDFPEYMRPDQALKFHEKFAGWTRNADLILTPSNYSKARIQAHSDRDLSIKTIPLAIEPLLLPNIEPENAWLILGTIEPRKNHIFLIDLWEEMARDGVENLPKLWIVGNRGWSNEETFRRIETSFLKNRLIFELGALTDTEMRAIFSKAIGVMFPSHCEGFGLPFFEAVLAKKSCVASSIPPFLEAVGENSKSIIPLNDTLAWKEAIMNPPPPERIDNLVLTWQAHIAQINRAETSAK